MAVRKMKEIKSFLKKILMRQLVMSCHNLIDAKTKKDILESGIEIKKYFLEIERLEKEKN